MRLIKRFREDGKFDKPVSLWPREMENPEYLGNELERAGFKECGAETRLGYCFYPGEEGFKFGVENLLKLYMKPLTLIKLRSSAGINFGWKK
jgi:hypothetical protein